METELRVPDVAAVRRAVDRLLDGDAGPLLDLFAEDVELEVSGGLAATGNRTSKGARAVADYLAPLGPIAAFWQIDYTASGRQVIAWGRESFTVAGCGLEGGCEFALVFDLSGGGIARLQVIEDLPTYLESGGRLPRREAA